LENLTCKNALFFSNTELNFYHTNPSVCVCMCAWYAPGKKHRTTALCCATADDSKLIDVFFWDELEPPADDVGHAREVVS
jgi:hypothetical protein